MLTFGKKYISELLALSAVFCIAYILVGNYIHFEFLHTGYLDWFMHLYRIKLIDMEGLSSWNPAWSNGFNIWYSYQFISHLLILGISNVFAITFHKAMILSIVIVFTVIRLMMFSFMRMLTISRVMALFMTIVSYAYAHQWISIMDFSIYVPLVTLPVLTYLWIRSFSIQKYDDYILFASLSGITWILHPILGYTMAGLFALLVLSIKSKFNVLQTISGIILYVITMLPFLLPMGINDSFRSPILSSPQFLQNLISAPYAGLSLTYIILIVLAFILWLRRLTKIPLWATVLFYYCLALIGLMYLSFTGSLPLFINSLQIPRSVTLIALILPFPIAQILHTNFPKPSRLLNSILVIASAVIIGSAINMASQYMAEPVNTRNNILTEYFADNIPTGSIYYENITEANYFANPNLRFVTSYAEHMEPHPLSIRFNMLVQQTPLYAAIPQESVDLLEAYGRVLGIEYLFLPANSPLVAKMTEGDDPAYEVKDREITDINGTYTVLQATFPIINAYYVPETDESIFVGKTLPLPTINTSSYKVWDEEVMNIHRALLSGAYIPLQLSIQRPDRLEVNAPITVNGSGSIYMNQSYSDNWDAGSNIDIQKTSLRFMQINLPEDFEPSIVTLKHSWESWYWPSFITAGTALAIGVFFYLSNKLFKYVR